MHMPDIHENDDEDDSVHTNHAIDITDIPSKYNHIMNYYRDELFEPLENNLKGESKKKQRIGNDEHFSTVKEMFVRALGLNVKVGGKRRKQNVANTTNISENNKMNVNNSHSHNIRQKIYKNVVQNASGEVYNKVPYECKTYICGYCNKTFEDKGSMIFHLISHKYIRNAVKPFDKSIAAKIRCNDNIHRKQYRCTKDARSEKKRTYPRAENTEVINNNVMKKCDVDDDTVITQDRQQLQVFHDENGITDNFRDTDDCPIDVAVENVLNKSEKNSDINLICDVCAKVFDDKGSLVFHSLAHTYINNTIAKESSSNIVENETKQKYKEIPVKANDYKLKRKNENDKNIKTDKVLDEKSDRIANKTRVMTRRMHSEAHKLINDTKSRESRIITDIETIEEHKQIDTKQVNDAKVNSDKNITKDTICKESSNVRNNAKQSNRVTRRMAQIKNQETFSNKESTTVVDFICNDCGRKSKSKLSLVSHIKRHSNTNIKAKHGVIPHIISAKNNSNTNPKGLKLPIIKLSKCNLNHIKNAFEKHKCTLCEYKTPYASRFARHNRAHTQSFTCNQCDKVFRRSNDLKVHVRCHTGYKPFKCQCGCTFAKLNTLSRHLKTHTDQKPYDCDICTSKFKLLGGLKRHLKIHGEKTFKCNCGSRFSDGSSLKRHMRCHTRQKPYRCDRCKYSTANKYDLKRHAKTCQGCR